ncbi:DUF3151 domain-containing protein [Jatrophihabitans sp. YIM 134969]
MTTPHAPHGRDLLNRPTELPVDPAVARLEAGEDPRTVAASVPTSSAAWAALSSAALADDPVAAYAFARTGYHRGLDSLRKAGWKGAGPVPASHAPNLGVLRSFAALRDAAAAIGETAEVERLTALLADADPTFAA